MQQAVFLNKIEEDYKYMKIDDTYADVFIYEFVEERNVENQEGEETIESKEYIYNFNSFRVKQSEITEEMIKSNPKNYLNYKVEKISDDEWKQTIEQAIFELGEMMLND